MKILSVKQIKEADAYTIANGPISSIDLMERAASTCFTWITKYFSKKQTFKIFCGTGNNAGDGLAIARMLHNKGYNVSVYIISSGNNESVDFKVNEIKLRSLKKVQTIDIVSVNEIPQLLEDDIIIDSLFGTGLNKPIKGVAADVIKSINQSKAHVISIDVPSGLFTDQSSTTSENQIIKATYTLSFQLHKLSFLFAENAEYTGEVIILPIGLNEKFINACESNYELIEEKNIKEILKKRGIFSHKGTYGHAIIVAGSYGKMGAAILASKACLKTGAGLLTTYIPTCGYTILQTSLPEAMVICDENEKIISSVCKLDSFNALGIGPGIGTSEETTNAVKQFIQNFDNPMVIDADAINIIAENKTWLDFIPDESIFTPHPKEFERLVGKSTNQFERNKLQKEFSIRYNVFVVLKGHYTCITCPDGMNYFNPTGNPGMAKGGSGDALTGMLTGLLAQGYTAKETCLAGVYLHGLAADIAVKETSEYSLLASDIINHIGMAFLDLTTGR